MKQTFVERMTKLRIEMWSWELEACFLARSTSPLQWESTVDSFLGWDNMSISCSQCWNRSVDIFWDKLLTSEPIKKLNRINYFNNMAIHTFLSDSTIYYLFMGIKFHLKFYMSCREVQMCQPFQTTP